MQRIGAVVLGLIALTLVGSGIGAASADIQIAGVHPQPVTVGNDGEYIRFVASNPTDVSGWEVTDGYRNATFPDTTVNGTIVASTEPAVASLLTTDPVIPLNGSLRLAAAGDELTLRDSDDLVVDRFTYPDTPDGKKWTRSESGVVETPRYATDWTFDTHSSVPVMAFVLPDNPAVPVEPIANATDRVYLAGYELSDPAVVSALMSAADNGATVRVVVDGGPVGGQMANEFDALDLLIAHGIDVRVRTGERDPYRFHHPKYAVVDDTAIIMTENWKMAGTGGASSRGWGMWLEDPRLASDLATVFATDFHGPPSVAWTRHRTTVEPREGDAPYATYPARIGTSSIEADRVTLSIGPEMVTAQKVSVIRNATESIQVQQVSIGDLSFPLLQELIDAARDGVHVQLLVDASWYVSTENQLLAKTLDQKAAQEDLAFETRLIESGDAFEKTHVKGMIVDEEVVYIGSTNWNNVSLNQNREVGILIEDPAVARYYSRVFAVDWRGTTWDTPAEFGLVAVVTWASSGLIAARRLQFDPN